jgi:hypothetical protein
MEHHVAVGAVRPWSKTRMSSSECAVQHPFWQVSAERHMQLVGALQPNLWVPILDSPSALAPPKRHHKAVDRTARWLDQCLALAPQVGPPLMSTRGGSEGTVLCMHCRWGLLR